MHRSSNNWRLGLPLSLSAALMWAILPIMLKGLLTEMAPSTTAFYRFLIAGVLLYIVLMFRNKPNNLTKLSRPRLLLATLVAGLMLGANYLFFSLGVERITPSASQVLIQLAPIMLLIGSIVLFKEPFSARQWMGCTLFFMGLMLFFHHRLAELWSTPGNYGMGVLFMVLAAAVWAAYALIQKRILPHIEAQQLNLVTFFIGAASLLPFTGPLLPDMNASQWLLLILCGANTLIAYACFTAAMHHWQATRVSATVTVVPILTLGIIPMVLQIWPGLFEREVLNMVNYIGACLVVLGSLIIVTSK